jgi:cytochrome c-type biogenesis protein
MLGGLGLAFLAGVLTILSPCVLPILPIVLGTASGESRYGPFSLAAGMVLSFVTIGLFVALVGFSIGLDTGVFRHVAAVMLIIVGAVLLMPVLQNRFAVAAGPVSGWANDRLGGFSGSGNLGQFGVGVLLGAVWSPCVGPTLGAVSILAAQGQNIPQVAATMLVFGIGAAIPLLLLGLLSRDILTRWRNRMMSASKNLKMVFGGFLVVTGIMILSGYDKMLESTLVDLSPAWLTALTTQF